MKKYLFLLGHQPKISTAEIQAVFSLWKIDFEKMLLTNNYLIIQSETEIDCQKLMSRLGGTIKIGEEIDNTIEDFLLVNQPTGKIVFSITGSKAQKEALEIKKKLKLQGKSVRYIEANNTATILHNNLVEKQGDFTIINEQTFLTKAIQPIEEFGERDYGRPSADGKSGMIPPKLARMMVNLSEATPEDIILDPFCGSGTILAEAMSMGFTNLIGTDISEKAINDTEKNLAWLQDNHKSEIINHKSKKIDLNLFVSNVIYLSEILGKQSVNTIITEPYLGKPLSGRETEEQLQIQAEELAKLYLQSFISFSMILKPNSTVTIVIPCFRFNNDWIRINCIDKIKKLGFEPVSFDQDEYLLYWREKQYVGREIWNFKYQLLM